MCGRPFNAKRERENKRQRITDNFHGKLASGLLRKRNPCVKRDDERDKRNAIITSVLFCGIVTRMEIDGTENNEARQWCE